MLRTTHGLELHSIDFIFDPTRIRALTFKNGHEVDEFLHGETETG